MMKHFRRTALALAVTGAAAGAAVLGTGAALANPSDKPCSSEDVRVQVTKDPSHAAGHEAFLITYTAASPTTNCSLEGTPTAMSFNTGDAPISGVTVVPDASQAPPVNLTAAHPAESRIIQEIAAAPNPSQPTSVSFALPTLAAGQPTEVAAFLPAGEPLKGTEVTVTPVSPGHLPTQVPVGSPGDDNNNGQLDSSETPDNPDQLPTQVPPFSPGDANGNGQLDSSETPDNPDQPAA
ncbi:DUF4232 domain-containing protein [Saccharopolyspora erythraea]|uniref:DUF4232 domain-containing protein n=1 Tax=Saccharopolyspora erythraea TaxID=1836 RepID=UPI001BA9234E|nr:DUF4232 domain-containing protein [Saccharopolyspora erythraea]QUH05529.1 DUF4232 domain-containing protein [Saccharopolyspora erythraea]